MKKVLFILAIVFTFTFSTNAQGIVVEHNGSEIIIRTVGSEYKTGQTIEITRNRRGNDMTTYTNWSISNSPVLEKGQSSTTEKILKPCAECVLGQIVMYYEYARVKVKRVIP